MSTDRVNIPKASTLMGSLRSIGYTFVAAVADIIDNSITAQATEVRILFPRHPDDPTAVGILDNGTGMTSERLFEAMRYGSAAPEEEREKNDLGRFGMGMKSASLSQCRILTVVSFDNDKNRSAFSWDYSYILEKEGWIVQELSQEETDALPYIDFLNQQQCGTLVLWRDFDILSKSSDGLVYTALNELKPALEKDLGLIFHRFLTPSFGNVPLKIYINYQPIEPLDPFLESNPKTTRKKEITIAVKDSHGEEQTIRIKPFVLPYATHMSEEDKKKIGGIENLRAKQGFYVYRNNRLIIWGSWFNLKPRAELTKNARVRVDIPNSLDDIWGIDIKKRSARIPKGILNQLRRSVEDALEFSEKQQSYRGRRKKVQDDIDYIWDRIEGREKSFYYKINRESKLYQYIKGKMTEEDFGYLETLIKEIEENVPMQQIYIDKANNEITEEEQDDRFDEVYNLAVTMAGNAMRLSAKEPCEEIENLMKSEPFCRFPQLNDKLQEYFKDGGEKI